MTKTNKLTVKYHGRVVGSLSYSPDGRLCVFQYDKDWIANGFSISPLELPLNNDIFIAKPYPFNGNFGIFEDSMPDGYGRYLLHKAMQKEGYDSKSLSALDRLSIIGDNGMGALTYEPSIILTKEKSVTDFDFLQEKALEVLQEKNSDDAKLLLYNSGNSGGCRPKTVYYDGNKHWLVKFRHIYDPKDIGEQEFLYNMAAKKCGINVPNFKLINNKYFASERFDIDKNNVRLHTATAGGLLNVSLSNPILDYTNLLALTGFLTQNKEEVEEMFRRMVFNYLTDNKDDHCKNFSFLVTENHSEKWEWHLAPAYDLTLSTDGYNGQHATSVNGESQPKLHDFITAGTMAKLNEKKCKELFNEVYDNCKEIRRYEP